MLWCFAKLSRRLDRMLGSSPFQILSPSRLRFPRLERYDDSTPPPFKVVGLPKRLCYSPRHFLVFCHRRILIAIQRRPRPCFHNPTSQPTSCSLYPPRPPPFPSSSSNLRPPRPPHLQNAPRSLLIGPKHRPTPSSLPLPLHQIQLNLRTQNPPRRFLHIDSTV